MDLLSLLLGKKLGQGGGGGGVNTSIASIGPSNALVNMSGNIIKISNISNDFIVPKDISGNYICPNFSQPFEIGCKFKIKANAGSTGRNIFGSRDSYYQCPAIAVAPNNVNFYYYFTTNGSSWQYHDLPIFESGYAGVPLDTWMFVKITYDGTKTTFYADDGTNQASVDITGTPYSPSNTIALEIGGQNRSSYSICALADTEIDLNHTYIQQNGVIIWGHDSEGGGGSATLIEKTITQNGEYNATSDNANGYSKVTVNVSDSDYSLFLAEYLQFYGTSPGQIIGLPYTVSNDYEIEVDFESTEMSSNNSIIGNSSGYDKPHLTIYNNKWYTSTGGNDLNFGNSSMITGRHTAVINKNGNSVLFDGQVVLSNLTSNSYQGVYLWVGGRYASSSNYTLAKAKIYEYKITSIYTGNVICDLKPAEIKKNTDVVIIGLYDVINDVFYTSSGTTISGILTQKTITQNGTYNASDDNSDGYSKVIVNVASKRFNVPSLPSEYQEVEYLSTNTGATGHPYVRVDYSLKVGDCIECGFKGEHTILGPDGAWNLHIGDNVPIIYNTSGYNYAVGYQPYTDNDIGKVMLTFGAVGSQTYFNYGLWRSNNSYVYDGNLYPLYVYNQATFGVYKNGNNTLIIALIPCYKKATDENGFYDVVNNVFLTAPSGRTFGRGSDV